MNLQTSAIPESAPQWMPLCCHVSPKGRRCHQPVAAANSKLCRTHHRLRPRSDREANPLLDLPSELSEFKSYADITKFLARVLTLLAEGKISPRRAAVMSYIANSLLNSLRAAERQANYEAEHTEEVLKIDWTGIPRPERDLRAIAAENGVPYVPRENDSATANSTTKIGERDRLDAP